MNDRARRDQNTVTTLLAVSSVDGETPVSLWADPVTHRLLVEILGITIDTVIYPSGQTGSKTVNAQAGIVNFAAGMTSLTVTSSYATTSSIIIPKLQNIDATMTDVYITRGSGSFTLTADAAPTAETAVGFLII